MSKHPTTCDSRLMLTTGTDLKVTSQRLGHSSIAITADLFTHIQSRLDQQAADALDALITGDELLWRWSRGGGTSAVIVVSALLQLASSALTQERKPETSRHGPSARRLQNLSTSQAVRRAARGMGT
jgi:hypothetical protein